jgi:hypothetical protein
LCTRSCKASPLGPIVARQSITLLTTSSTNVGYFDSYDSSDPTKSSNGVYTAGFYSGDFGDISVLGGSADGASVSAPFPFTVPDTSNQPFNFYRAVYRP